MLRLILGISGTGKTGRVLARMKVRAAALAAQHLLVPEQFSSSAETMVYRSLGDAFSACAEVYSFTSFAELVLKTFGGAAVKTLTDAAGPLQCAVLWIRWATSCRPTAVTGAARAFAACARTPSKS